MRNLNRIIFFGLFAAAVFIIFNCAGYLVVSMFFDKTTSLEAEVEQPVDNVSAQGEVVSFATPTPKLNIPTLASASLPQETSTPQPTPVPLLPTVTPTPPATSAIQPSDTPRPPTAAAPSITPTAVAPRPTVATAAPDQLQVISHQSYIDSLGWYHIVGEVENKSNVPMEYVEVMAKLYNTANEVIGTKLTFTAPDIIFPGGTAPFDIIALRQSQWRNINNYTLQVKGEVSSEQDQQKLILLTQNSRIQDHRLIVDGEIQNIGQTPALAKLIVTLYDANKNVINTGWSYADQGIISANGVSAFEIKVDHNTDPNNFSYRIQIEEELIDTD